MWYLIVHHIWQQCYFRNSIRNLFYNMITWCQFFMVFVFENRNNSLFIRLNDVNGCEDKGNHKAILLQERLEQRIPLSNEHLLIWFTFKRVLHHNSLLSSNVSKVFDIIRKLTKTRKILSHSICFVFGCDVFVPPTKVNTSRILVTILHWVTVRGASSLLWPTFFSWFKD